ncbi:MAG: hypothetical protein KIH80_001375 [Flavobacteriia bacterium]|nr:hypothetical protein [Flavobacteriia bacterium]
MQTLTTLSQTQFDTEKKKAIGNQLIRKEINLSEFNVVDNTHIKVDGITIELTEKAFKRLLGRLRIPIAFANRFSEGFGDSGLSQLVTMMKTNKASKNDQTVTLMVDPNTRKIVDILPAGYASISNESFVDFSTRYIDQYGLAVTHMGSDLYGGVSINCVSQNGVFRVPGMDAEIFNTGVTFRNTPSRGLEVSPFLNRLICTNGMSSTSFAENYNLHNLSNKNIQEFNDHMIQMASTGFQPVGLADKIRKANNTDASLAELQRAASSMLSADKAIDYDYIQRYAPIERAMKAYANVGADPATFTSKQLQNAKSGISVWDMVNGITNFASNDEKYSIDDHKRGNLMVTAGNLLTKKNYDTEALLQFDPFATTGLLTDSEGTKLRGEA